MGELRRVIDYGEEGYTSTQETKRVIYNLYI